MEFVRREVTEGKSRLDFLLREKDRDFFIEVKSVSLVISKQARFPDAPTERGTKHLNELISIASHGKGAAVVFVIQRSDAKSFSPNWDTDPLFSKTLVEASEKGVLIFAYRSTVNPSSIRISERVPIIL
jgi:sugar fermentation stimulation protein A